MSTNSKKLFENVISVHSHIIDPTPHFLDFKAKSSKYLISWIPFCSIWLCALTTQPGGTQATHQTLPDKA